jgi:1-acyl-sn-glycerol-3-phosphate acyltransferase
MTSDDIIRGGANPANLGLGQRILFELPWLAAASLLRLIYGFRVEGAENLPGEGPFILVSNEHSPIAFLITGWMAIVALKEAFQRNPETISFLREELFDFPFFRSALNEKAPGRYAALTPVAAGRLALGLLEAYRTLQGGGVVVLNPEGDMPWDGRPLPIGHALAWLGLHTAAPIVPAMITAGAYDIWPRWQARMNLKGHVRLRIGKPFRLSEAPLERVTDADMAVAERTMRTRFDALCYERGGVAEWSGVPTRRGVPVEGEVRIPSSPARPLYGAQTHHIALWRRGIALLLWRCPVCHTDDSLVHERPILREQTLRCRACGTRWRVRHIPGKDFRLEVVEGPGELVGLDMALSGWYDEMRRNMHSVPSLPHSGEPGPDEHVITETSNVMLLPRRPNALLENWDGREPPRIQPRFKAQLADWQKVGMGRLVLTDNRLIWHGPRGELDFWWDHITSVSLWMLNTLTIRYGAAPYRFELGQENGLKWLTYSVVQAERAAARTGRKLNISSF